LENKSIAESARSQNSERRETQISDTNKAKTSNIIELQKDQYNSPFLQRMITGDIMQSYSSPTNPVTPYKANIPHSIGHAISHLMSYDANFKALEKPKVLPINVGNIKKMNCRNARAKMHESLIGSMMRSSRPLSRARSNYCAVGNGIDLIQGADHFARVNLLSPSLSIYNRSINGDDQYQDLKESVSN
jgi:hypothetical protein